jgi:hypothetical protein
LPLLNVGETGILGIGALSQEVVMDNGNVKQVSRIPLSLCDIFYIDSFGLIYKINRYGFSIYLANTFRNSAAPAPSNI